MFKAFQIIIGCGFDANGKKLTDVGQRIVDAQDDALKTFGGFTQTQGVGGFTHEDGREVIESCVIFTICTDQCADSVIGFAGRCRKGFNQESVAVIHPDGHSELV